MITQTTSPRRSRQDGIKHAINVLGKTAKERAEEKVRGLLHHSADLTSMKQSRNKGKLSESLRFQCTPPGVLHLPRSGLLCHACHVQSLARDSPWEVWHSHEHSDGFQSAVAGALD